MKKKKLDVKNQAQEDSSKVPAQAMEVRPLIEESEQKINELVQQEEVLQEDEKLSRKSLSSKQDEKVQANMVSENMVEIIFESDTKVINQDPLKMFSLDYTKKPKRSLPPKISTEMEQNSKQSPPAQQTIAQEKFEDSKVFQTEQGEKEFSTDKTKFLDQEAKLENVVYCTEHGVKVPEEIIQHPFSREVAKSWGGVIYHFENKE